MQEFLITWGSAIGIFILTGTLMEALNRTIGAKAGDHGFRGVWFTWRRFFLVMLGVGLGLTGGAAGLSSPIGDGWIYGGIDGIVSAWAASGFYDLTLGWARSRAEHLLAKDSGKK